MAKKMTKAQAHRAEMNKMRSKIQKMKDEYSELVHAENMELLKQGIKTYGTAGNWVRSKLRLLGTKDWDAKNAMGMRSVWDHEKRDYVTETPADVQRYVDMCKAFDVAMGDLKRFYNNNEHEPLIKRLIEQQQDGNSMAERALIKIFRNAKENNNRWGNFFDE